MPSPDGHQVRADSSEQASVDMVAISRTILRIIAHLEKVEYTDSCNEWQADVVVHDDPPDPANDVDTMRG